MRFSNRKHRAKPNRIVLRAPVLGQIETYCKDLSSFASRLFCPPPKKSSSRFVVKLLVFSLNSLCFQTVLSTDYPNLSFSQHGWGSGHVEGHIRPDQWREKIIRLGNCIGQKKQLIFSMDLDQSLLVVWKHFGVFCVKKVLSKERPMKHMQLLRVRQALFMCVTWAWWNCSRRVWRSTRHEVHLKWPISSSRVR